MRGGVKQHLDQHDAFDLVASIIAVLQKLTKAFWVIGTIQVALQENVRARARAWGCFPFSPRVVSFLSHWYPRYSVSHLTRYLSFILASVLEAWKMSIIHNLFNSI